MKKIQWVAVSVCFVLAVTLWFLVTLNKQSYTTSFDVPVKLTNFPSNLQLLSPFPNEMRVYAQGPGIKLLYQDFDPMLDTVSIDFFEFKNQGHFLTANNLDLITGTLKEGLQAVGAEPDTIFLAYAVKSNKRVPVRLDVEYDLPPSYRIPKDGFSYTDTVVVSGPPDSLKYITEVRTKHTLLPHSVVPMEVFVPLDSIGSLQMLPNLIRIRYSPVPFTEKVMRLPVRPIGVPVGTVVHFDPDTVVLKLLMPLSKFATAQTQNIAAEVRYDRIDGRSKYVIPDIVHLPGDVSLVSFSPQLVRYMLITQE